MHNLRRPCTCKNLEAIKSQTMQKRTEGTIKRKLRNKTRLLRARARRATNFRGRELPKIKVENNFLVGRQFMATSATSAVYSYYTNSARRAVSNSIVVAELALLISPDGLFLCFCSHRRAISSQSLFLVYNYISAVLYQTQDFS